MLNIKPEKIYKIIRDTGKPKKEEIIRCVEMMALEAEELCKTWENLIKLSRSKGEITKREKAELQRSNLFGDDNPFYGRLLHFYRNISMALGNNKGVDWIEKIYNNVAKVVLRGHDADKSLDEFNNNIFSLSPLYLSSKNVGKEIKDLESSLQVLQNEVATLKSLPETLRLVKMG
jgi:hypothetical protein